MKLKPYHTHPTLCRCLPCEAKHARVRAGVRGNPSHAGKDRCDCGMCESYIEGWEAAYKAVHKRVNL
jgi:hypothetical protein